MHLLDLPADLLVSLPFYLDSIDDLYNLLNTSRVLYSICNKTKAALSPRLSPCKRLKKPHAHWLIAVTARQVADWAVKSLRNCNALHSSLMRGLDGLLELCVDVARVSLGDMRRVHQMKRTTLQFLLDLIEEDRRSRNLTLWNIDLAVLNHAVYCELFHHSITADYKAVTVPCPLTADIRQDYLRYCVPDTNCRNVDFTAEFPDADPEDDWALECQQDDLVSLMIRSYYRPYLIGNIIGYSNECPWKTARDTLVVHQRISEILAQKGLLTMRLMIRWQEGRECRWVEKEVNGSMRSEEVWDDDAEAEVAEVKDDVERAHREKDAQAIAYAERVSGGRVVQDQESLLERDIAQIARYV